MNPLDLADQLDLYAAGAQQASAQARTVENAHYHLGAGKAYGHAARMVREYLVPTWTREVPTKPGTYWYRWEGTVSETPVTVHVIEHQSVLKAGNEDEGYSPLWDGTRCLWPAKSQWSGPIVEPSEPTL